MMNDEAEKLLKLYQMANANRLGDLSDWIKDSMDGYLFGEIDDFEEALGIKGENGSRKAKTKILQSMRDQYILRAWEVVSDDNTLTPWGRSRLLADELNIFSTRVWPRVSSHDRYTA